MKRRYLVILFLIPFLQSSSQTSNINQGRICWDRNYKINWSDFQGNLENIKTSLGIDASAISSIRMECLWDQDDFANVEVVCYFDKTKSFTRDTSEQLLNHERLHFDIYELYTRKLRKALDSLNTHDVNDSSKYVSTVEIVFFERDKYSARYDAETGHGISEPFQRKWNLKVENQLKALCKYELKSSDCDLFLY